MAHLMVDVDDVLIPTMATIHKIAHERGLHDGSAKMAWAGWTSYGCAEDDYWECWTHFAATGGYVSTPPIPGSLEALRRLLWEGHEISLVTARGFFTNGEDIKRWTREWVEEWAVPHHNLVFAKDKVGAQVELGIFDYAIDDSPKNVDALTADGVRAYLLDHEHNQAHQAERRVSSLWEWAYIIQQEGAAA